VQTTSRLRLQRQCFAGGGKGCEQAGVDAVVLDWVQSAIRL
jgi:hypothetical protein